MAKWVATIRGIDNHPPRVNVITSVAACSKKENEATVSIIKEDNQETDAGENDEHTPEPFGPQWPYLTTTKIGEENAGT